MDTFNTSEKTFLVRAGLLLLVVLSLYFAVKTIAEIKNYNFIGGGAPASNTISFEGRGEVSAVPDIALINFTLRGDDQKVQTAQSQVTEKEKAVLEFLETSGIEKKDIKTESYNSYPKYDYDVPCFNTATGRPCPSTPKVIGYEVSEYISVKVRDLTQAGEIVAGLGRLGVTEISGPNFSIENEDDLKAEARKLAIDEAKDKAKTLADDLGVRLVRIVNFSENGNYPMPFYAKNMAAVEDGVRSAPPAPELPFGENKIISNIIITYEIR